MSGKTKYIWIYPDCNLFSQLEEVKTSAKFRLSKEKALKKICPIEKCLKKLQGS
jgi:hypothetical protein